MNLYIHHVLSVRVETAHPVSGSATWARDLVIQTTDGKINMTLYGDGRSQLGEEAGPDALSDLVKP